MTTTTKPKTIRVTWYEDNGTGYLHAQCDDDHTLSSNNVRWSEPIDASSDSHDIAAAVTEINGAEIVAVDHDGDQIHVIVRGG